MSPHLNVSPRPIVQGALWSYSIDSLKSKQRLQQVSAGQWDCCLDISSAYHQRNPQVLKAEEFQKELRYLDIKVQQRISFTRLHNPRQTADLATQRANMMIPLKTS